jgi:hypothetical protein
MHTLTFKEMTGAIFIFFILLFYKNTNNIASVCKINWTTIYCRAHFYNF